MRVFFCKLCSLRWEALSPHITAVTSIYADFAYYANLALIYTAESPLSPSTFNLLYRFSYKIPLPQSKYKPCNEPSEQFCRGLSSCERDRVSARSTLACFLLYCYPMSFFVDWDTKRSYTVHAVKLCCYILRSKTHYALLSGS